MKHSLIVLIFALLQLVAFGQSAGKHTYQFLELPPSARVTALGGTLIAVIDDDINLASLNPALLNESTDNAIAFNHNFHFAGINNGNVAFGKNIKSLGINGLVSFQYISYGDFKLTDEYDQVLGDFSASEKAIVLGASKKLNDRMTIGANLKGVFSTLESYSSTGIATDLGLTYHNPESNFIFSAVIKNWGTELATYRDTRLTAPLDIQIGISKKLNHLPFRFSLTAHQLQQWSIRYDDPNAVQETDLFGNTQTQSSFAKGIDNFFRHMIFSGEFLLGKKENLRLRIGYNHLRRKELAVSGFRSFGGFSLGFGMKINRFRLDYGVGYHHIAGAVNHLSISTNINHFKKALDQ